MTLFTNTIREELLRNGALSAAAQLEDGGRTPDFRPVAKLFTPDAASTWLLTELDPVDADIAFGLCDLGFPELGVVSIAELSAPKGPPGLKVERDLHQGRGATGFSTAFSRSSKLLRCHESQ